MTQKHLWHLLLILFVLVWSAFELTPLEGRNLITEFQTKARNKDATFSNIVAQAETLQKDNPIRTYGNLRDAIGTNDITKYFSYNTKGEKNPSLFVLNRLQREAAGQIKLGLDLKGGVSFLVGMNTPQLSTNVDRSTVLENAVDVLRKRVDRLGVAEPIIQPSGADRIMIQLPGLTQAEIENAKALIERAAFLEFRMVHPESDELMAQGIIEPGYEVLSEEVKAISWKAQHRLHSRYRRLIGKGKSKQQAVTAVARELLGFIWAIGVHVEQQHGPTVRRVA